MKTEGTEIEKIIGGIGKVNKKLIKASLKTFKENYYKSPN